MKMKLRLLAFLLAVVMSLSLFACGETPAETTASTALGERTDTTESTESVTDDAPATETTDKSANVTDEVESKADEETEDGELLYPDLPQNYYNSTHAMSIDELKEKLVLTLEDFDIAESLLEIFENAALGQEALETGFIEEIVAYADAAPADSSEATSDTDTSAEATEDADTATEADTDAVATETEEETDAETTEEETTGIDYDYVDALYMDFEDKYLEINTQISILQIIYYYDMSDEEISEFYVEAFEKFGDLYNSYIETCKIVYTDSPISDELFADWTEEEIKELFEYDPKTQELRSDVEALQVELNAIPEQDPTYNDRAAEIYAQIVTKNNELARILGYDNYYEYASKEIYGRDYGIEELQVFSDYVAEYFKGNIAKIENSFNTTFQNISDLGYTLLINFMYEPFDSLPKNYLDLYIKSYKTGSTRESFHHLFENGNFLISNNENSHPSAFQTYVRGEGWDTSICFFGTNGQDTTTIVHEMGHYYASLFNEDVNSYDLAETQSQANEMLLLAFVKDHLPKDTYDTLVAYTMYNYVAMTVVCVIIDEYERAVYALDSVEGYGSDEFDAIMAEVCEKFGGIDYVNNSISDVKMYWRMVAPTNPVYYISYATSMIAALNIYSVAAEDQAEAREIYKKIVEESTEDDTLLTASEKAGLSNIFEEQTFIDIINAILGK